MIDTFFTDTTMLMLLTLPVMTTIYSIIAQLILKDKFIVTGIMVITYLLIARFLMGKNFLPWIIIYAMLSFIITWVLDIISKHQQNKPRSQQSEI